MTLQTLTKAIHFCQEGEPLSGTDIQALSIYAANRQSPLPELVRRTTSGLARTLLLGPERQSYVLMTASQRERDKVVGSGSAKKAKFAVNLQTGEVKVVAVCRRDNVEDAWDLFQSEIEYMKSLKDVGGLVRFETAVVTEEKGYIVMKYCNRGDLYDFLDTHWSSMTPAEKRQIAHSAAVGLKNLHARGLIHRDIKPENIFLSDGLVADIGDFGYLCSLDDEERRKESNGTLFWISPEKANVIASGSETEAEVIAVNTQAGDVWALGAVFYTLFHPECRGLTCQQKQPTEMDMDLVEKIAAVTQDELLADITNSGIDPKLAVLLCRMLRVKPEERIGMEEVVKSLQAIISQGDAVVI